MLRSCIVCGAGASPDFQLQYCAACQSAMYCSKACQRKDWKKQHRQICKLLNVGRGDMQVRMIVHMSRSIDLKEQFERHKRSLDEDMQRFFNLFHESTFEGSMAAALEMRTIAEPRTDHDKRFLMFHSFQFLIWSDSKTHSWPNSSLLVMLQFVDPSVLFGIGETRETPLHHLADLAAPIATTPPIKTSSSWQNSLSTTAPTSTLYRVHAAKRHCTRHAPGTT
jgi:hypothetical protein